MSPPASTADLRRAAKIMTMFSLSTFLLGLTLAVGPGYVVVGVLVAGACAVPACLAGYVMAQLDHRDGELP